MPLYGFTQISLGLSIYGTHFEAHVVDLPDDVHIILDLDWLRAANPVRTGEEVPHICTHL
jgi:hypothetical protein